MCFSNCGLRDSGASQSACKMYILSKKNGSLVWAESLLDLVNSKQCLDVRVGQI